MPELPTEFLATCRGVAADGLDGEDEVAGEAGDLASAPPPRLVGQVDSVEDGGRVVQILKIGAGKDGGRREVVVEAKGGDMGKPARYDE
jgi:hypothetical protein